MTRRHSSTTATEAVTTPIITVLYCRVSNDKDLKDAARRERSVGEQETDQRADCDNEGFTVAKVFKDNNRSASENATRIREEWQELLDYLDTHEVHVLSLWETSRASREPIEWFTLLKLCKNKGIQIRVFRDRRTYDLNNIRDWKTLADDGVDNAYEVKKLRERVVRSQRYDLEAGKPNGPTPFGYIREFDPRTRAFIGQFNDGEKAEAVVQAYERVDSGWSCSAVADDWNERGFRTFNNKLWSGREIAKLLKRVAYLGLREHISTADRLAGVKKGELIKGMWEPISNEEDFPALWKRVNRKLSNPTRNSNQRGLYGAQHLLSGIAICGVCDSVLRPHHKNGQMVYHCKANGHVSVNAVELEALVEEQVPDRLMTLVIPEQDEKRIKVALAEAEELEAELEHERYLASLPVGHPERQPSYAYRAAQKKLVPEIEARRKIALTASVPANVLTFRMEPEKWTEANLAEKRNMLRSGYLVDGIVVNRKNAPNHVRVPLEDRVDIQWVEERLMREVALAA